MNLKASDFEELKLDDFEPVEEGGESLNTADFEPLSESDFQPAEEEKGIVDKVVSLFSLPEAAQKDQAVRDAARERVAKSNNRGFLREGDQAILFGNGEEYENPDAPDYNIGKGMVNRTNELTGNMAQGFGQAVDSATQFFTGHGSETKKLTSKINDFVYENNKMDYVPTHDWKELKTAFKKGGVFDVDSWQELGNYVAEQGMLSIPDMGEMVAMLPGYIISRTQEIAETRTEEDGRKGQEPNAKDYAIAAPTAAASIFLDRLGLKATTTDVFKQIGEDILTKPTKELIKSTMKKVGEGTLKEAGTEFIQEGVIESAGERIATENGKPIVDIDRGIGAAVAGGGAGGVMGGTTALGAQAYNSTDYGKKKNLERAASTIIDAHDIAPGEQRPVLFRTEQAMTPPEEKRVIIEATKDTIADITPEEAAEVIEGVKDAAANATPEEVQEAAEVIEEILAELTPQEEAELAELLDIPESELTIDDEWRIEDLQAKLNGEVAPGEPVAEEFEELVEEPVEEPITQKSEFELSEQAEPKEPEVPRSERLNSIKRNPRLPELVENIKAARDYEANRDKKAGIEAFKAQLEKEGLHPTDDEYKQRMTKHMNTRREESPYDVFSNYSAAELRDLQAGKVSSAMLEKLEESMAELENNPEFNEQISEPQLNTIQKLRQKRDAEAAFGEVEATKTESIKPVYKPEETPLSSYNQENIDNARMLKYRREKQRKAKQPKELIFTHPEQGRPIKDDAEYKREQETTMNLAITRDKTENKTTREKLSRVILDKRNRLREYTGTEHPTVTEDNIGDYQEDEQTILREEGKVLPGAEIDPYFLQAEATVTEAEAIAYANKFNNLPYAEKVKISKEREKQGLPRHQKTNIIQDEDNQRDYTQKYTYGVGEETYTIDGNQADVNTKEGIAVTRDSDGARLIVHESGLKPTNKGDNDGRKNTTTTNETGSEEPIERGTGDIDAAGQPGTEERGTDTEATPEATIIGETRNDDAASNDTTWETQHYINREPYSVSDINHEYPNKVIAKLIQRDLSKFVKELAEQSGLNPTQGKPFNGVYVNLPPAGGEASFTLWDSEYKYGARFDIKIEPDYNEENGYDDYATTYTVPIELVNNENQKIRGIGYMGFNINKYYPDQQPYSTKEIAADIKKHVADGQAEVDHRARMDEEIAAAKLVGQAKHQPFGELNLDDIVIAKAVHGKPDLVVHNQVGQWVELPSPAHARYGKYGRLTGNYDMDYDTVEVEVSKSPSGKTTANVPTFTTSRVATIQLATERKVKMFLKKLGYKEISDYTIEEKKEILAKEHNPLIPNAMSDFQRDVAIALDIEEKAAEKAAKEAKHQEQLDLFDQELKENGGHMKPRPQIAEAKDPFDDSPYGEVDYKKAQDLLVIEEVIKPGSQGSLFGQSQMDIREQTVYKTPIWAKPITSNTVRFEDIVSAINAGARRNNAVPSALGDKAIAAMLKNGIMENTHRERVDAAAKDKNLLKDDTIETATNHVPGIKEFIQANVGKKFLYNAFANKDNNPILTVAPMKEQQFPDQVLMVDDKGKRAAYIELSRLNLLEETNEPEPGEPGENPVRADDRDTIPDNASEPTENTDKPDDRGNESDTTRPTDTTTDGRSEGDSREQSLELLEDDSAFILEQQTAVASGEISRYNDNIAAIRLLKENKPRYTLEEKKVLSRYTGWGGLQKAFQNPKGDYAKGWEERARKLTTILTEEEFRQAKSGVLDAYYTPVETVKAMWNIAEHLGFNGGLVLEPSMGTGRFLGLTPEKFKSNTAFNGVELDPTTYKIAKALYKVNGRNKGFQETNYKGEHELVIGNPPYAKQIKIVDKNSKALSGLTIHDYFVAKSLDAVKDGGIVTFVITSSFMDSMTAKARHAISQRAKLVGAIRLPSSVFAAAGTKVTTDIIVLQKLTPGEDTTNAERYDWYETGELNGAKISQYYIDNPEMMLGEWKKGYRGGELIQIGDDINSQISEAMTNLPANIMNKSAAITKQQDVSGADTKMPASVIYEKDGEYYVNIKTGEGLEPQAITGKKDRVKDFITVRDLTNQVIDLQLETNIAESVVEERRAQLNAAYDSFFKKHGYLNNSTNRSIIVQDKSGYTVLGLEEKYQRKVSAKQAATWGVPVQEESGQKADILTKRTIKPEADVKTQDSSEALLLSVYRKGGVDFDYMREITGKSKDTLVKELKGKIFKDERAGYVTRDVFLSGDVKTKLDYTIDEYAQEELKKVIPADKEAHEIVADIGASWISVDIHREYMQERLGFNRPSLGYNRTTSKWSVPTSNYSTDFPFGAETQDTKILESALNNKKIVIRKSVQAGGVKKSFIDEEATTLVNSRVDELKEDFANWIFASEKRRNALVPLYNELYNRYNKAEIEDKIEEYKIPNLKYFVPRQHQTKAVYRAVFGDNPLLLNHTVGSGKTLTSQMIAMEWRRLGKANKPLIVALKSTVEQFTREFKEAYPSAKVLLPADSDFTKANRKRFLSSIATGDYDAIVLSHEQLMKLENPFELQKQLIEDEIDAAQEALIEAKEENDRFTVRDLETAIEKLEARYEKLTDTVKDQDVLSFEKLGIDGMIVDESHQFKKLAYSTSMGSIKGMPSTDGSLRAFDLFVKTKAILQKNNNLVFMTGTPVTNTLPELFLIQKYLQEDVLQDQGLEQFDAWAKNYADPTTDIEMTPTGGFKEVTRMKSFKNIPILMETAGQIIDTVTNEDIKKSDPNFHLPELNDGKPKTIFIEPSQAQLDFTQTLIERLATVNDKDNPDNHLAIFGDAVKMSMDMRLLGDYADEKNSKVNEVVSYAMEKYKEFESDKGTQLIFSDIGTPKGGGKAKAALEELIAKAEAGNDEAQKQLVKDYSDAEIQDILYGGTFSIYEDIRSKLIAAGVKASEIAFIHDYGTKPKKDELSKKVNNGEIRFVLGSTKKLGTGMNVQKKLTAVHHIDIPYTPAELEQRNGRIIRQGNTLLKADPNFKADIFYYATKQTLDGVKWQILENKAKFIQDFMSGVASEVDIEEESNSELAERMKAEASGNPFLIDKIKADKKVKKLEALKRGFETNQAVQQQKKQQFEYEVNTLPGDIAGYEKDIAQISNNEVKINGKTFKKPGDMGKAVYKLLDTFVQQKGLRPKEIGNVGDITITIMHDQDTGVSTITFNGEVRRSILIDFFKQQPEGIGTRINNELARYEEGKQKAEQYLEEAKQAIIGIDKKLEEKFSKWEEYKAAKAEQQEAIENIEREAKPQEQQPNQEEPGLNFFDEVDENGITERDQQFITSFANNIRQDSKVIDDFLANKSVMSLMKFGESYTYLPGSHKVAVGQTNVSRRDMIIAIEHEIAHFKTIGYLAANPNDPKVKHLEKVIAYMKKHEADILSKLDGNSRDRVKYILSRKEGIIRTAEAIAVLGSEKRVALDLYSILGKENLRLSDIIAHLVRAAKNFIMNRDTIKALQKNKVSAANLAAGIKQIIEEGNSFNESDPKAAREARAKAIELMPDKKKEASRFSLKDDMRPGFIHLGDFANLPFALSEMLAKGMRAFNVVLSKHTTGKIHGTKAERFMDRYLGTSSVGLGLMDRAKQKDFLKHFRVLQARLSKADISAEEKAKIIEDAQGDIHDDLFNMMAIDYLENPAAREEIAIEFPELAAELDQVREYINRLSEEAMQRGIILPSQHALWKDRYLSRLYLATQKPEVSAKVSSGIKAYEQKSGRKIDSIVQYLLDNPNEQERLGAILDVDLMIKQTIAKTQGNIGIDEFFRGITERSHIADTDILIALSERVNNLPMMFSPYYATEVVIPYIQDMIRRLDEDIDFEEIYELEERIVEIQNQIPGALDAASYLEIDKDKAPVPKDKRYGSLAGLMLPRDVQSLVVSQFVMGIDPQTIVEKADSWGRKFLTYFKWAKVPANIFSYFRNVQSNFWQWSMSGADPLHFFKEYALAAKSMITKDSWYQKARENGILNTNSISVEVNDSLKVIAAETSQDSKITQSVLKAMSVVGDAYGLVDDIAKIARMKYAIEKEGMSIIDAVDKAQDTHFDYALTYDLVRGMRDPDMTRGMMLKLIGTLFPTYTQKTIAFLYDTIADRPASLLMVAAGLTAIIKGGEEEDRKLIGSEKYDEILKTLPEWTENNPLIKVSMKHGTNGNIEVTLTDISYVIPFGSVLAAASSAVHGDIPGAAGNIGLGGSPFQMMSNLKNNMDAFSGREIYYEHDAKQATIDGAKYIANQLAPGTITKVLSLMDTKHPVPIRLLGINSYVYDSRELEKYNEYAAKEALMDAGKRATKFKRKVFQADKDLREGKISREKHQEIVTKNEEEIKYWKDLGEKVYNEKSVVSSDYKDYNSVAKKVRSAVKELREAGKEAKKENGSKEALIRFKQNKEKLSLVKKYETVKAIEREVKKFKKVKEMINGKKMDERERAKRIKAIDARIDSLYAIGYKKMK